MSPEELQTQVNKQIGNGRTGQALESLLVYTEHSAKDYHDDVLHLKGRYKRNEKDNRIGLLARADYILESNRINNSILQLLDAIIDSPSGGGNNDEVNDRPVAKPQASVKILFLASNPIDTGQLRLGEELREIEEGLKRSNYRDHFELVSKHAVRPQDLFRGLLDENPQIVHFSGHGFSKEEAAADSRALKWKAPPEAEVEGLGIALEDNAGNAKVVNSEALSGFFGAFDHIQCVFLNNCYSHSQAEAIVASVPFVIGMKQAVNDRTAILFAVRFYDALGSGRDIPKAFALAKSAIMLEELPGEDIPVLLEKT